MLACILCICLQLEVSSIERHNDKLLLLLAVYTPATILAVLGKVGELHTAALGYAKVM
jgi:hypothetical protein